MFVVNKKDKIIAIEIILCLFIKVFIYYFQWEYYSNTYNGTFIQMGISVWIIITLINWNRERKENNNFRSFTFVLLVSALIIFFLTKPNITFNQGKDILKNNNYNNIEEFEYHSVVTTDFEINVSTPNAYLYSGYKNGENLYLLVSPKTGKILEEKIGIGSYLDDYVK